MSFNQKKQDKLWEYFQNCQTKVFDLSYPRLQFFADHAKPHEVVLNVGIGNALLEKLLYQKVKAVKTLDPSNQALRNAKKALGKKFEGRQGYLKKIPFPSSTFDRVICTEVFEHLSLQEMQKGLREIFRVLKPSGILHGTVPFQENLETGFVICPKCNNYFHRWGHQQGGFDKSKLQKELEQKGFVVKDCRPRTFVDFKRPGWRPFVRSLARRFLGNLGEPIVGPFLLFEAVKKA